MMMPTELPSVHWKEATGYVVLYPKILQDISGIILVILVDSTTMYYCI